MQHPARLMSFNQLYDGLQQAVADRFVRENALGALRLYCYTEQCVYNQAWSDITRLARGIILDVEQKQVVATPFVKFFNLHETTDALPDMPFEVFEKLDGSLIILFHHNGQWRTSTKGHLSSPQAIWAAEWIKAYDLSCLTPGDTYLLEAIYPDNRVVIEYDKNGLSFLAAYDAKGAEHSYAELLSLGETLGWEVAQRHAYTSLDELIAVARNLPATEEGFILRYANGYRVKIKGEEYCRIHRLINNCTPLFLWESMYAKGDLEAIRRDLPEEFWPDFDSIVALLTQQREKLEQDIQSLAESLKDYSDKDIGLQLDTLPADLRGAIFPYRKAGNSFDTPKLHDFIWRRLRPTNNALEGYTPSANLYRVANESG